MRTRPAYLPDIRLLLTITALLFVFPAFSQKIGIGLGGIGGYGLKFVDAAKTMRAFETPGGGDVLALDENGWPEEDFKTVVMDARPCCPWLGSVDDPEGFVPPLMAGIYKLSFNGKAAVSGANGVQADIRNIQYHTSSNLTTADLVVSKDNWLVILGFTNTQRTSGSSTNTGVTNIKLLRPGYHNADSTQIFRYEFLNAVSHFPVIRFMDFTGTNNSNKEYPGITEWIERTRPTDALFHDKAPWEYVVELANLSGKDIWINVPVDASDDYVSQLAQLFKDGLNGNQKIYIEYSNEVWNPLFDQYHYNIAAANAEVDTENSGGAETNLNNEAGQCDPNDERLWGGRRYVRRLKEIGDIFIETFSPGSRVSFETRIRPVFAWQIGGWVPYYSCILKWFESEYGDSSAVENFYGLAGASYVSGKEASSSASPEEILEIMMENSDKALGAFRDSPTDWTTGEGEKGLREIADIFGIRLLQYETGPANGGGDATNVANRIRANRHFRMKGLIEYDLGNNWIDHPEIQGGLAMYFVLSGSYNRYGCWGATEDMDELHTYKLQALYNLNGTVEDTQGPTFPSNITTTTDGNDIIVKWEAASDDNRVSHYRIIDDDGALATVPSDSLSARLQDYDQSKISQLQVTAFDAFNNESGDSIITGIPRPGVGTPPDQIHLYPNPVSSQLTIITDFTPDDHADIIQVSGRWIKSIKITGSGPLYINVADLPEGMYILLLTGDKTISRVFIKQN